MLNVLLFNLLCSLVLTISNDVTVKMFFVACDLV